MKCRVDTHGSWQFESYSDWVYYPLDSKGLLKGVMGLPPGALAKSDEGLRRRTGDLPFKCREKRGLVTIGALEGG